MWHSRHEPTFIAVSFYYKTVLERDVVAVTFFESCLYRMTDARVWRRLLRNVHQNSRILNSVHVTLTLNCGLDMYICCDESLRVWRADSADQFANWVLGTRWWQKHNNVSLLYAFSVQLSLRMWLTVTQTVLELYLVKNKLYWLVFVNLCHHSYLGLTNTIINLKL